MLSSCHGLLVVDKPAGLTSRAALDRAQRWFPRKTRMGHTGTLDPLATGVLVLSVGMATRLGEYVQAMPKTYRSVFLLGARSDTDDAEGTVTPVAVASPPDRAAIEQALRCLVGAIDQVPPAFSAAHVTGRRAYDLARQGEKVNLEARRVEVYGIDLLSFAYPRLEVEVRCGKGTYIRSLARDLGERLGCGGLVEVLRRTRVGPFSVDAAVSLEAGPDAARAALLPVAAAVVELPRVDLPEPAIRRLCQGAVLPLDAVGSLPAEGEVAVFNAAGELILIASVDGQRRLLRPAKVLAG